MSYNPMSDPTSPLNPLSPTSPLWDDNEVGGGDSSWLGCGVVVGVVIGVAIVIFLVSC